MVGRIGVFALLFYAVAGLVLALGEASMTSKLDTSLDAFDNPENDSIGRDNGATKSIHGPVLDHGLSTVVPKTPNDAAGTGHVGGTAAIVGPMLDQGSSTAASEPCNDAANDPAGNTGGDNDNGAATPPDDGEEDLDRVSSTPVPNTSSDAKNDHVGNTRVDSVAMLPVGGPVLDQVSRSAALSKTFNDGGNYGVGYTGSGDSSGATPPVGGPVLVQVSSIAVPETSRDAGNNYVGDTWTVATSPVSGSILDQGSSIGGNSGAKAPVGELVVNEFSSTAAPKTSNDDDNDHVDRVEVSSSTALKTYNDDYKDPDDQVSSIAPAPSPESGATIDISANVSGKSKNLNIHSKKVIVASSLFLLLIN
ncbi:uncharacterized protein LOC132305471 [Cornus florida]|uniref:uncharacterized protein LOC132305471 n=1 Tax=Cornus florida TaxID=4283 RepID=UPI00289EE45F|nr:uncharacterized protein LOC132305471 [Cornus florida]